MSKPRSPTPTLSPPVFRAASRPKDLWLAYRRAWRDWCKAITTSDNARLKQAKPNYSQRPASLTREIRLAGGGHSSVELTTEMIESITCYLQVTDAEAEQLRHEHRQWTEACNAVDKAYGLPALKKAEKAAEQRYLEAERRFIRAPVRSIADIALKLRYVADVEVYEANRSATPARVVFGLIRDIEAGVIPT